MAPCALLLDEIEKGFAYGNDASTDAGLSRRVMGRFLNWLQEHKAPVFVVATCNQVAQLPPELMRKGRFDEIFFVELPTEERKEIFTVHLKKRQRDAACFDLDRLAAALQGFCGAEIESALVAGLYTAFSQGTELATALIEQEVRQPRPLSVTRQEEVSALRHWAHGRAVPAS